MQLLDLVCVYPEVKSSSGVSRGEDLELCPALHILFCKARPHEATCYLQDLSLIDDNVTDISVATK